MRSHLTASSARNPIVGVVAEVRHYRECLVHALKGERDLTVLDMGSGGSESTGRLGQDRPDLVVADLRPTYLATFVRRAHRESSRLLIVALGVRDDERELLALFEFGMAGFVPTGSSLDEVFSSIRMALRGELLCPPRLAAALARRLGEPRRHGARHQTTQLTAREDQVLRLVAEGLTNKEIATRLSLEASTIKNHVHSILHKLSVGNRTDAAGTRIEGQRPVVLKLQAEERRRG